MKTTIARTARQLAAAVLMPILAAACQAETPTDAAGNEINPDGTVTITHLLVGIDGADPAATRAGDVPLNPSAKADGNETGDVPTNPAPLKTTFAEGDVLHIAVTFTLADARNSNRKLSTATRGADGRWTLAPALRLPQNPSDTYRIDIFYDGKPTEYNRYNNEPDADGFYHPGNFFKAYGETNYHANDGTTHWLEGNPAKNPALPDGYGNAYVRDALQCQSGPGFGDDPDPTTRGTLAITSRGVLTIGTVHRNALVRISSIVNQLGSPVQRAEVLTVNYYGTPGVPGVFTLFAPDGSTADGTPNAPRQALIGASVNYCPTSIRITLEDGRKFTLPLPNAGTNGKGFFPEINRVYAYRLTLLPGAFSAVMDNDNVAWTPKADPIVPEGYTAIRTRADLEAIGAPVGKDTDGKDLYPGMAANYILMNDIDLTPANPAAPTAAELWTPLGYRADLPDGNDAETKIVPFTGRFNGNGHTLRGLTISSTKKQLGLFARLNTGAIVYNLHFSHAAITGTNNDGANAFGTLAGNAYSSTIQQCSATDCTVAYTGTGTSYLPALGGLVGKVAGSAADGAATTLIYCHATRCTVSGGNAECAGGLVGMNMGLTRLVASYTRSCTVNARLYAGGLVGYNDGYLNLLYGCYAATASATATGSAGYEAAGALVGRNINNGGSSTDITATNLIASCYATNAAATPANKLVGSNSGYDGSTAANARILACVSPLAYKVADADTKEEPNREGIVDIYPRGGSTGYRALLEQLAFTHLGSEGLANLDLAFRLGDGNPVDVTPGVIPSGCALTLRLPIVQVTAPGSIQLGATPTDWRIGNVWSYMDSSNQSIPPTITWNK